MLVEMKTRHIFCRFYNEKVLGHSIHSAVVVLHGLLVNGRFNINHMIHIHIIYIYKCLYIYIYYYYYYYCYYCYYYYILYIIIIYSIYRNANLYKYIYI